MEFFAVIIGIFLFWETKSTPSISHSIRLILAKKVLEDD